MGNIKDSRRLLTAGGVETYLIFIQQVELREFCGFEVYRQEAEAAKLEQACLAPAADAALASGRDLLLDALTWRAHADFVQKLGYPQTGVEDVNRLSVARTRAVADRWRARTPGGEAISIFVNGDVGPRGDGYRVDGRLSIDSALGYHRRQVAALAAAGADVINALTMTHVEEAVAIARAASEVGLPCIVSPTVETDGRTPQGISLGEFIRSVEDATQCSPLFYMVNCAHPVHLEPSLRQARDEAQDWLPRFRGFRANASRQSHQELDNSTELDRGHPQALAAQVAHLEADFGLTLVGGCCGTDAEHIACIAQAVSDSTSTFRAASAGS